MKALKVGDWCYYGDQLVVIDQLYGAHYALVYGYDRPNIYNLPVKVLISGLITEDEALANVAPQMINIYLHALEVMWTWMKWDLKHTL